MFDVDIDYIIRIRREIHMYPETDFDLPKTVSLIKRELNSMNIPYTEEYGQGSVVGYINPDKEGFTIALRADTDALYITEKNDIPYLSRIDGKMHACGHDAHTANLLGTAKILKSLEDKLNCRIKLIFQPSEEGAESGAKMMVENGVLNNVDVILGMHVDGDTDVGKLCVRKEASMASGRLFTIEVYGKTAHAASPHLGGVDALAVAVRLYTAIQIALSREINPKECVVCSIGVLESGVAANIIPDYAMMRGTLRTFNMHTSDFILDKIKKIANGLMIETNANIEIKVLKTSMPVYNNPYVTDLLISSMNKVVGEDNVIIAEPALGLEDFSWYQANVPGVFFSLGTRNVEKNIIKAAHNDTFNIDEDALELGCRTFVQFILDNHNGIDLKKAKTSDKRII